MSVDNVQSFGAWVAALPSSERIGKTLTDLKKSYDAALASQLSNNKVDDQKGVKVQTGPTGDSTDRSHRADANATANQEMEELKKAAAELHQKQIERSQKKQQGEYAPVEFTENERIIVEQAIQKSGENKPLYKNKKAQKELTNYIYEKFTTSDIYKEQKAAISQNYTESWSDAQKSGDTDKLKELNESHKQELNNLDATWKKAAKAYAEAFTRKDRLERTRVFNTQADKANYENEHKEDIAENGLRLKIHNKEYIGEQNQNLLEQKSVKEDGISLHQAAYEKAANTIGSDKIGDPNEVQNLTDEAALGTNYKPAEQELRRLGYDVKDDTWNNIAKALIPGAGAFISAASFTKTVTATANAVATIQNPATGEILASAVKTATATETLVNWAGAGVAGVVSSIITAALFGGTEDEHVLNGTQINKVFEPSVNDKKYYQTSTFGEHTNAVKIVLEAIDNIEGLTDEQKTQALREAAGTDSREFLSSKELIDAYMKAVEMTKQPKESEVLEENEENETNINGENTTTETIIEKNTITPVIDTDTKTITKPDVEEKFFEYKRESGEYWIGIAGEMYLTENDEPISPKEANAIGRKIKADHGFAPSSPDMPNTLQLSYEIEVDGKKYKLKKEITRNPYRGNVAKGKEVDGLRRTPRKVSGGTAHTFTVTVREGDKILETFTSGNYDSEDERNAALANKKAELKAKYPSRSIETTTTTES